MDDHTCAPFQFSQSDLLMAVREENTHRQLLICAAEVIKGVLVRRRELKTHRNVMEVRYLIHNPQCHGNGKCIYSFYFRFTFPCSFDDEQSSVGISLTGRRRLSHIKQVCISLVSLIEQHRVFKKLFLWICRIL